VAEVAELPRFVGRASASDHILINKDFDRSEVSGKASGILVRLGQLVGVLQFMQCDSPSTEITERSNLLHVVLIAIPNLRELRRST
jgi:hypothetical protein